MPKDWKRPDEFVPDTWLPSRARAVNMLWEILAVLALVGIVYGVLTFGGAR